MASKSSKDFAFLCDQKRQAGNDFAFLCDQKRQAGNLKLTEIMAELLRFDNCFRPIFQI